MRNEVRNMDVSVKARLKNIAKEYKKLLTLSCSYTCKRDYCIV